MANRPEGFDPQFSASYAMRACVAFVFFFAGIAKIARPQSVAWLADLLPALDRADAEVVAYWISSVEIALGAGLLFRRTSVPAIVVAMVLLGTGALVMTVFGGKDAWNLADALVRLRHSHGLTDPFRRLQKT